MRALVIGGTGVISTAVVGALKRVGAAVTVFNRGRTDDRLSDAVRRLMGDRDDFMAFEDAMRGAGTWDVVIDMICFRPDQAESALRAFAGRCGHFIFCSTVCTYGNTQTVIPTIEDTPQTPHSKYGRDKLACEQCLLRAHQDGKINLTTFRPAHTYGPGGPVINNLGWAPTFVDRLRRGMPIIVSGDGHGLWQSAYADDVGAGFASAAGRARCFGEAYNIVADEVVTWDEYTCRTAAALGAPEPNLVHIPTDILMAIDPGRFAVLGEIFRFHAVYSNAKIKRDVPEYTPSTPYEKGVRETVAWMDRHNRIRAAETDPVESELASFWARLHDSIQAASA